MGAEGRPLPPGARKTRNAPARKRRPRRTSARRWQQGPGPGRGLRGPFGHEKRVRAAAPRPRRGRLRRRLHESQSAPSTRRLTRPPNAKTTTKRPAPCAGQSLAAAGRQAGREGCNVGLRLHAHDRRTHTSAFTQSVRPTRALRGLLHDPGSCAAPFTRRLSRRCPRRGWWGRRREWGSDRRLPSSPPVCGLTAVRLRVFAFPRRRFTAQTAWLVGALPVRGRGLPVCERGQVPGASCAHTFPAVPPSAPLPHPPPPFKRSAYLSLGGMVSTCA